MININGLNKAEVLAKLYNNSRVQGLGFLQAKNEEMSIEEATSILQKQTDFDYLFGKVMKINLSSDESFNERLYDRDNGTGAAERVIASMR